MKHLLVTGGAGFIGRWLVAELLGRGNQVTVLDDLSNGSRDNLVDLEGPDLRFVQGTICDSKLLEKLFTSGIDECYHLAAQIVVQQSLDNPADTFHRDVEGTFHLLEVCRRHGTRLLFTSTCMVYDLVRAEGAICEEHPVIPRSPYAGAKLAAEHLALSYYHGYGLPVTIVRPFNTYGPYQRSDGDGGVVSVFYRRFLTGQDLRIFGDGTQTRDLLFATDCARFIALAGESDAVVGSIINAGTGRDVSINHLASLICPDPSRMRHVPHIHPQSEIQVLRCNAMKAEHLLSWKPRVSLEEGLSRTLEWHRSLQ